MKWISALLAILFCSACSSIKKNTASDSCSLDDEKFMAKETLVQIRRDYPALQDEKIQTYVSQLGQSLVNGSQLNDNPYTFTFTVVDTPEVHAFSLPAGYVFVSSAMLNFVDTEDELAGILSHEIAHVVKQHSAKKMTALKSQKNQSWWYGGGGAVLGGVIGVGAASTVCMNNPLCTAHLASFGAAGGLYSGLFLQKYSFLRQSQENELIADQLGFEITQRAGFDPKRVSEFYSKIEKIKNKKEEKSKTSLDSLVNALSTHPSTEKRIAQIQSLEQDPRWSPLKTRSTESFDSIKKQLLFH